LRIAKIEAHRILLIATFRPEFQPTWVGLANVTLLTVSRLPRVQQSINRGRCRVIRSFAAGGYGRDR